jgi:ankyrin repeat protein
MEKPIVVALFFAILLAASAHAETTDFLELVKTATALQVQEALQKGADLNERDSYGRTLLMHAAMFNRDADVINVLFKAGADINARDNYGWTALMLAARGNQNPDVISAFVQVGADPNARDRYTLTALMYAAISNQNPEVITMLLNTGAEVTAKDVLGRTAFDYALENVNLKSTTPSNSSRKRRSKSGGLTGL